MKGNCHWDARITDAELAGRDGLLIIMTVVCRDSNPNQKIEARLETRSRLKPPGPEHLGVNREVTFQVWREPEDAPRYMEYYGGHGDVSSDDALEVVRRSKSF
jgi:hypothetical protein